MFIPYVLLNDGAVRYLVSFDSHYDSKKKSYVVDYAFFNFVESFDEVVRVNDSDLILALKKYVNKKCKNVCFCYTEDE